MHVSQGWVRVITSAVIGLLVWTAPAWPVPPAGGSGAKWVLPATDPNDNVTVVRVSGSPYEMGYWYGRRLSNEVRDNLTKFSQWALVNAQASFGVPGWLMLLYIDNIIWPGMLSYIPQAFLDEMQGVTDGVNDANTGTTITFQDLYRMLTIVELSEFNCTSMCAVAPATDGRLVQIRNLDFSLDSRCQDNPVITVYVPNSGPAYCNVGFAGLIGSLAGFSDQRIAVSQVGLPTPYARLDRLDLLQGIPMTLLLKRVLSESLPSGQRAALDAARDIVEKATRTSNYGYGLGDGTVRRGVSLVTGRAIFYSAECGQVLVLGDPNDPNIMQDPNLYLPAVPGITYLPHDRVQFLHLVDPNDPNEPNYYGRIHDPNVAIAISRQAAMVPNLMNVVYDTQEMRLWVAYAQGLRRAADGKYVPFNFGGAMPDPMVFAIGPNAIGSDSLAMTGVTATSLMHPLTIEYSFTAVPDPNDANVVGHSSTWQADPNYTDTALKPNTKYRYKVRARDQNDAARETASSAEAAAWTLADVPPAPAVGSPTSTSLVVSVSPGENPAATDLAIKDVTRGLYIRATGAAGDAITPVWRTAADWGQLVVKSLQPNTTYEFVCFARNGQGVITAQSASGAGKTLTGGTIEPNDPNQHGQIQPDPMTFAQEPSAPGATMISMQASVATQVPVPPVLYLFEETTGGPGATTSYWQQEIAYIDTGLRPNTLYAYRVKARDSAALPNETQFSTPVSVCTLAAVPPAPQVSNPWYDSLIVRVPGGDNPAETELALFDRTRRTYIQANGTPSDASTPVWRTAEQWGLMKLNGLQAGTRYDFVARARNINGVVTAESLAGSGSTLAMPPTSPTLQSVTVVGPDRVNENSTATYTVKGQYSDGSEQTLTGGITWRLSTVQWGVIAKTGQLFTQEVPSDQQITVYADVIDSGGALIAQKKITIANVPVNVEPNEPNQNTEPQPGPGILCPSTASATLLGLLGALLFLRKRSA
jgi:hypothetical protein